MDVQAFDMVRFASDLFIRGNYVEGYFHGSRERIKMERALQLSLMSSVQAGFLLGRAFCRVNSSRASS